LRCVSPGVTLAREDDAMLNSHELEVDTAAPIDMLEAYYAAHGWESSASMTRSSRR
jgi:hypothetical protein